MNAKGVCGVAESYPQEGHETIKRSTGILDSLQPSGNNRRPPVAGLSPQGGAADLFSKAEYGE